MEDATLRPTPSAVIAVGWPWLLISALFAAAAFDGRAILWVVSGLSIALFATAVIWVFSHKLVVKDNVLSYRSLFHAPVSIGIQDIAAARSIVGIEKYSDRFLPTIRIEIVPVEDSRISPFVINRKVFRKAEIDNLLQAIADDET